MPGTLLVAAMIAASALAACHDLPTAPRGAPFEIARSNDFTSDPQWGRNSSPNAGSWDGEVSAWDGSTPFGPGWSFPYRTIIIVSISGEVKQADGALPGSGAVWPPTGLANINGTHGAIGYVLANASGSAMVWPAKTTDTVAVQHEMRPMRGAVDGPQRDFYPDPNSCGVYNNQTPRWACFTYLGAAHLQFTRVPVKLTLTPSVADTGVIRETTITFTAGLSIPTIRGMAVDMSDLRWRWVPDMPSADSLADNPACTGTAGTSCTVTVETSGTLFVSAYVNGEQQQRSVHVTANPVPPLRCLDFAEFVNRFPEIANTYMDTVMRRLWRESKYSPDTLNTNRRERGGYILKDPATEQYSFKQFEISGPCHTTSSDRFNVPANVVAEIHTQPFSKGESLSGCGKGYPRARNQDGTWDRYERKPSGNERTGDYGALLFNERKLGRRLMGFILDADGLITYDTSDLNPNSPHPSGEAWGRCSY